MNVNGMNGKQFVYSEMGVKWLVTQLEHDVKGDQHHFKYRVDAIIYDGGMPQPPIGHVTSVMSTEGYEHHAGWRVEEYEPDPFEEREYPLRKGSIIRSPEGILASRSSPGAIPLTSDAWAEINDVLDAYGDALDRIELLQGMVDKAVNKALERRSEIERLRDALTFYADPATYDIGHLDKHGYIIIDRDGGQKAREVLSIPTEDE